jgi:hypothetical protein
MAGLQAQNDPIKASVWSLVKANFCIVVCVYDRTKLLSFPENLSRKNNLGIFNGLETNAAPPRKHLATL